MSRGDFWSRRRAAVEAEERAEALAAEAAQQAEQEHALEEVPDAQILTDLDLPDPDSTDDPAELRRFLTEAVPQRLKTRALRRIWRLNPMLANLDGLVDYGEDFTDSAMVVENLQTVYQVGKGMFDKVAEAAAAAEAEAKAATDQQPDTAGQGAPDHDTDQDQPEPLLAEADQPTHAPMQAASTPDIAQDITPEFDAPAPAPRRMRFQFDTTS